MKCSDDRNQQLFDLKNQGWTYNQLSEKFGISKPRIYQIYRRQKQMIDSQNTHINALNGIGEYTFHDALMEVCSNPSIISRIEKCFRIYGIEIKIENDICSLDLYSDNELLHLLYFGTVSLSYTRQAIKLYKEHNLGVENA